MAVRLEITGATDGDALKTAVPIATLEPAPSLNFTVLLRAFVAWHHCRKLTNSRAKGAPHFAPSIVM